MHIIDTGRQLLTSTLNYLPTGQTPFEISYGPVQSYTGWSYMVNYREDIAANLL